MSVSSFGDSRVVWARHRKSVFLENVLEKDAGARRCLVNP